MVVVCVESSLESSGRGGDGGGTGEGGSSSGSVSTGSSGSTNGSSSEDRTVEEDSVVPSALAEVVTVAQGSAAPIASGRIFHGAPLFLL